MVFNAKFFCGEAKFTLAELGRMPQSQAKTWTFMSEDFMKGGLIVAVQLLKEPRLISAWTIWLTNIVFICEILHFLIFPN